MERVNFIFLNTLLAGIDYERQQKWRPASIFVQLLAKRRHHGIAIDAAFVVNYDSAEIIPRALVGFHESDLFQGVANLPLDVQVGPPRVLVDDEVTLIPRGIVPHVLCQKVVDEFKLVIV